MRISEFWRLMDEEFGPQYSRTLARDLVISELGGRAPMGALEAGIEPRQVWNAVCDMQEVPPSRRWGKDIKPQ